MFGLGMWSWEGDVPEYTFEWYRKLRVVIPLWDKDVRKDLLKWDKAEKLKHWLEWGRNIWLAATRCNVCGVDRTQQCRVERR